MVGELGEVASDRFPIRKVLRFEGLPISRKNELCFLLRRCRTLPEGVERQTHVTFSTNLDVNVVTLKNSAREIGLVCRTASESLDRRFFVPERLKEGERKAFGIERLLSKP